MSGAAHTTATFIPCLRYRDAPEAIDWLCRAFGFEKQRVVPGEGDTIAHAQLTYGHGMIMLGSAGKHGGGFDELQKTPAELGGACTQSAYVIVEDADAHLAQSGGDRRCSETPRNPRRIKLNGFHRADEQHLVQLGGPDDRLRESGKYAGRYERFSG